MRCGVVCVKNREHFLTDEGATELLFLALRNITKDWKMPPLTRTEVANRCGIIFPDRFTASDQ